MHTFLNGFFASKFCFKNRDFPTVSWVAIGTGTCTAVENEATTQAQTYFDAGHLLLTWMF